MNIGITGVFCSGKTTASKLLAKKGYKHINADEIGHKLLKKKEIRSKVIREFGKQIIKSNQIDRRKLKDIVFYNKGRLKRLNRIIHPYIIREIKSALKRHKKTVVDGALLIETGCSGLFDKLIVVKISRKQQLKRALKKKRYTKEEIKNIIGSQLPQKEKLKYADIIIDNSGNLKSTINQVKDIEDEIYR